MSGISSLAAKRRLSLDLVAASKANDARVNKWTTPNINQQNGSPQFSDIIKTSKNAGAIKSARYRRKSKDINGLPKVKTRNKNTRLKPHPPEVHLTCSQTFLSWRYLMALLLSTSFVVAIFLRNCLPMAMVCMVRPRSAQSHSSASSHRSLRPSNRTDNVTDNNGAAFRRHESVYENDSLHRNDTHLEDEHYEFYWDAEVQGLVLTSIMFSTFLGPLLVSVVKDRLGCKLTMTVFNLVSTLLTFLTPLAARISPYLLMTIRVLLGISLGGNVPVVGDCVAYWAPQREKLTIISLAYTGVNVGSVMASFLSGYLCLVPLDNGWPFIFYTFGFVSLLWVVFWHFLGAQKPEEHPYISEAEKQYIISQRYGMDPPKGGEQAKPQYRKVLTSVPVLAYFVTGTCHIWTTQVLFTYLPVFFNKYLRFSVQDTGLITSLTSLFRMLGSFFWTAIGNKTTPSLGVNISRKLCICIGFSVSGMTMIAIGFFDESYRWVVLGLLVFAMVNQSVGSSTITALPLDMAPRYAGLLTGMHMSIGSFVAISGPMMTSAITANGTHEEWRIIWIIMSTIFIAGAATYLFFGQASLQPWAQGKATDMPHILSPFVTMGRRFSTFMDAPPLSPVTPLEKGFDLSQRLQNPAANVLVHIVTATPEALYGGHFDFGKSGMPQTIVESAEEIDEQQEDGDNDTNDEYSHDESEDEQKKPARRRAFSEFGLEVVRQNSTKVSTDEEFKIKQDQVVLKVNSREEQVKDTAKAFSDQIDFTGTVNEGFDNTEDSNALDSDDVQISRL